MRTARPADGKHKADGEMSIEKLTKLASHEMRINNKSVSGGAWTRFYLFTFRSVPGAGAVASGLPSLPVDRRSGTPFGDNRE